MSPPRWYMINAAGMATLCASKDDAEAEAKDSDLVFPRQAPHRAVQLVEVKPSSMNRDDVLRLAREAGFEVGLAGAGIPQRHLTDGPVDAPWLRDALERFAAMLATRVIARQPPPPLVLNVADIDTGELRRMLADAKPMPVMPLMRAPMEAEAFADAAQGLPPPGTDDRDATCTVHHTSCPSCGGSVALRVKDAMSARAARQAAQIENEVLKDRLARSGLAHRRATLEAVREAVKDEREACAALCEVNHGTINRNPDSFQIAAAIRARGAA